MKKYNELFNNFDETYTKSADAIFRSLFDKSMDHPLEYRYANLRLPRQVGKTTYLKSLQQKLNNKVTNPVLNTILISGLRTDVTDFYLRKSEDITEIFERIKYKNIDIFLFDEVKPSLTVEFLKHPDIVELYSKSKNFVAFGLHTMDTL